MRIRDLHLFNEHFPSVYETQAASSNECSFFTLPVVDGYLWSKPNQIAGLRLKALIDGKETALEGGDPKFTRTGPSTLHISWPLKNMQGTFEIELSEQQVKMTLVSATAINWFFDLTTAENVKLPFDKINDKSVVCHFENMPYLVKADKGAFSTPGNGSVWRISPELNIIKLQLADAN